MSATAPLNPPPQITSQGSIMFDAAGFAVKSTEKTLLTAAAEAIEKENKRLEAEKKKKDEEEEEEKAKLLAKQDKSRPISSTPIAGTPW